MVSARPILRDGPRLALVAIWLGTALVSVLDGGARGAALLGDLPMPRLWVWLGAGWDLVLGLWLLLCPSRLAYAVAFWGMVGMTLAATAITPHLWLDPLGALLKNLAIAALLLQGLHRHE